MAEAKLTNSMELHKITKPCINLSSTDDDDDDDDRDQEYCVFRIPRGLFDPKDLVGCEIEFGGRKPSKLNIQGKRYDITMRPFHENPIIPWLPGQNGSLIPVNSESSILGEVQARLHLPKWNVCKQEHDLDYLRPAEHTPPDLPARDFFSGYSSTFVQAASSKVRSREGNSPLPQQGVKRGRHSIEELTPQDQLSRPTKKRKGDPLVANFRNVFNNICSSPGDTDEKKDDATHSHSEKKKKKSRKSGVDRMITEEVANNNGTYNCDASGWSLDTNSDTTNSKNLSHDSDEIAATKRQKSSPAQSPLENHSKKKKKRDSH
ncbi:uncharacterized protein LOC108666033 [Hyalella azteca]|uniref:Uncharacterized protein LOC108666033 n=1 Tax=Hyalella azteca TaxID=294128 RepID=A0A8B7N4Y0_HYAAZ|nr:uncharacterized protein LOC108666033 [Hyalella azteca]